MKMEDLGKRLRASGEAEKRELCADIDARAYGGPVS